MNNQPTISWTDFEQVQLLVGTIIAANDFAQARKPAYLIKIDFGDTIGVKKSSAQITHLYSKEELLNKQVIAVVNFPPKQIGPILSECLICGFYRDDGSVVLAVPDQTIHNGAKLS